MLLCSNLVKASAFQIYANVNSILMLNENNLKVLGSMDVDLALSLENLIKVPLRKIGSLSSGKLKLHKP